MIQSAVEEYATRLYSDFDFFLNEVWHDQRMTENAPLTEVEREMANYLACGPRKRGVLAERGIGKTTIVGVKTCWYLYRNPRQHRHLIVSQKHDDAVKIVGYIRHLIDTVPFLRHLAPEKGRRDAANSFTVAGSQPNPQASVTAVSIDGKLEGNRAHEIDADDIETDGATISVQSRQWLDMRVKEFRSILYPERPGQKTGICFVGTFHHETESVYLKLNKRDYRFITFPLEYPAVGEEVIRLAPCLQKNLDSGAAKPRTDTYISPTMPHRFDAADCAEKRAEGPTHYAMQHMLLTNALDLIPFPLRLRDLIVFEEFDRKIAPMNLAWGSGHASAGGDQNVITDLPNCGFEGDMLLKPIFTDTREWAPYNGTKMWIDPAGKGKDKTAYSIVSSLNAKLWWHITDGLDGGYDKETLEKLALAARDHHVTEIKVEEVALQGMFVGLFGPILRSFFLDPGKDERYPNGWRCTVEAEPKWHRGIQKEVRILEVLEPIFGSHRLVASYQAMECTRVQQQITRLTRQRDSLAGYGDDEVESLAACCWMWGHTLDQDPQHAADQTRLRLMEDEEWEEELAMGGKPEPASWLRGR